MLQAVGFSAGVLLDSLVLPYDLVAVVIVVVAVIVVVIYHHYLPVPLPLLAKPRLQADRGEHVPICKPLLVVSHVGMLSHHRPTNALECIASAC